MKTKGLEIGNYVYDRLPAKYKIKKLELEDFAAMLNFRNSKHPNTYHPIPLTEDWLLKFGFKKMPESEHTLDTYDFIGFKLWLNDGKILFNDEIEIKYVHQLQNLAYILAGKELELMDGLLEEISEILRGIYVSSEKEWEAMQDGVNPIFTDDYKENKSGNGITIIIK